MQGERMAKPKSVAKAEKEVDDILKKMAEEGEAGTVHIELDGQTQTIADAKASPGIENPPPVVQPPAVTPQPPPVTTVEDDWKHKYDVLQGKYNAEVPRLNTEARLSKAESEAYKEQLNGLQEQINYLLAQQQELPPSKPADNDRDDKASDSIKSLEEQYGAEFVAKLKTLLNKEMYDSLKPYSEKLNNLEARQVSSAWDSYYTSVAAKVPNWQSINKDPKFIDWLSSNYQQFSGKSYMDVLRDAHSKADAHAVTRIFEAFLNSITTPAAAPAATPPVVSQGDLETLVSPGKSKTNITPDHADVEFVSLAKVEKFYDDLRRGKYIGKEAEANKLDEFYTLAVASGRVK